MKTTRIPGAWRPPKLWALLLLAAPSLFLATFFYLPMATVFSEGLRTPDGALSLARLSGLLGDSYVAHLVRFTVRQAALSSLLSVLVGVPLAYILANRSFPGRRIVSALTFVPFVLPPVTVALGFLLTFGANGWFNQLLDAALGVKVRVLHSLSAILLAHAFYNAPIVARTTQAAWEQLDPALEESARSLGARPAAVFWGITLPGILPGIMSGAVLAFIYSFMSFPIVLALGGARYSTLEVEIYTQIRVLLDYPMGASLAALQAAISLTFAYLFLRFGGARGEYVTGNRSRPLRSLFRERGGGRWVLWTFIGFCGVLFAGPVAAVFSDALTDPKGSLSLAGFARLVAAEYNAQVGSSPLSAVSNSLRFGFWAAILATSMGVTFSFALVRGFRRRYAVLETLALAPLVVSSVALGFGSLLAFRTAPLDAISPDGRVILIHAVLGFPLVVRAFQPVMAQVDPRLVDAARTLGTGRMRAFFDVELPLVIGGLLVAFALAFGLSVSEMSATMMLARPGLVTMPIAVYRFLASRDFHAASAMAVLLIGATGGAFLFFELLAALLRERRIALGGLLRKLGPGPTTGAESSTSKPGLGPGRKG